MNEPMRQNMYLAAVLATALVACGGLTPSASKSDVPGGSYRGVGTGAGLESLTALAKRFEALHRGVTFKLSPSFGLTDTSARVLLRFGVFAEVEDFAGMVKNLFR